MKKYTMILKDENGQLSEKSVFAEDKKAALASEPTAVTVTAIERIKHPTPEALARVMAAYASTEKPVILTEFYTACDQAETAIAKEAAAHEAAQWEKAKTDPELRAKLEEKKAKAEKAKIEAEKAKAAAAKADGKKSGDNKAK